MVCAQIKACRVSLVIFYSCPYILYVDQKYFFAYLFGKLCFLKRSRASSSALVLKALTSVPPPPGPDILMGSRKSDAKIEVAKKKVTINILENRRRVMKKNVAILADSLPLSTSRHNTMFLKNWQHLL